MPLTPADRLADATGDLAKLMRTVLKNGGLPGQRDLLRDIKRVRDAIDVGIDHEYVADATILALCAEVEQISSRVFAAMPGATPA